MSAEAWEKRQRQQAEIDAQLLRGRQLLYKVSRHPYGSSLLSKAITFLELLTQYKGDRPSVEERAA